MRLLFVAFLLVLSGPAFASAEPPDTSHPNEPLGQAYKHHAPGVRVPQKPGEPDNTLEPDNTVHPNLPGPGPAVGSMMSRGGGGGHR